VAAAPVGVRRVRFPPEVTVVAVRWYLRFGLSYRDVEELHSVDRVDGHVRDAVHG
jgi:transposase-like protein